MVKNSLLESISDKETLLNFIFVFSRFEYSLKRSIKYLINNNSTPEPDWNKFAKVNKEIFSKNENASMKVSVAYYQHNRPKRQKTNGKEFTWKDEQNKSNYTLNDLLLDIRRVRNNLFHGGKYPSGPEDEVARNTKLLSYGTEILLDILKYDSEVEMLFHEEIKT